MKTLKIEVPEALAAELEELVAAGWFTSEEEIGRLALEELVRRRPFELQERFQREDVEWAAAQKEGVVSPPSRKGERERFVEAVEEGLADAEAGRVIPDEELGAWLDEELGPLEPGDLKSGDLKKRLRKDRPMTTVSLRMPEDVVDDLKRLAPRLGFTSYQALVRAYVGQGLRRHLGVRHEAGDPSRRPGDEVSAASPGSRCCSGRAGSTCLGPVRLGRSPRSYSTTSFEWTKAGTSRSARSERGPTTTWLVLWDWQLNSTPCGGPSPEPPRNVRR